MKCRPGSPDSISDFGRLLFHERNRLAKVSHAFSSCQYFDFYVIDFHFFFCVRVSVALIAENFRLFGLDPETHFFRTFLEITQHFLKLLFTGCEQQHVVGKPQIREAVVVVVALTDSHSLFLLPSLECRPSVSIEEPC